MASARAEHRDGVGVFGRLVDGYRMATLAVPPSAVGVQGMRLAAPCPAITEEVFAYLSRACGPGYYRGPRHR